jgi:CheY-like chemotaxis protein
MALEGLRLLLVEDEPLIGLVLQDIVEELGGTVAAWAETRADAEQLASSAPVDLAILDINLHGEPSYPAAEILTRLGTPFFFVTGYAHQVMPDLLSHVPVIDKPYTVDQLIHAARSVLQETRPSPPAHDEDGAQDRSGLPRLN